MEVSFEWIAASVELVKGTPVVSPYKLLNMTGFLSAREVWGEAAEATGRNVPTRRQKRLRTSGESKLQGALDVDIAPFIFQSLKPVASPSTPIGATLSRLWEFVPLPTGDSFESFTLYWGTDVKVFRAPYGLIQSIETNGNADATAPVSMAIGVMTKTPTQVATPAIPALTSAELIPPLSMQVWLDTSSAIGTTELVGKVVSIKNTITTGLEPKYLSVGPAETNRSYVRHGRKPVRLTTTVTLDVPDMTEYDIFASGVRVKMRTRYSGALIEVGFYEYVEYDNYGPLRIQDWGVISSGNRTLSLTVMSDYESTITGAFRAAVQNDNLTL